MQKGEGLPVIDAMVSKGQRSMRKMDSWSVRLAPARAAFRRPVMEGTKVEAKVT